MEAFVSGAVPGAGRGLAGARGWGSAAWRAPGSADGGCANDCGRASWSASGSVSGCWSGCIVGGTAVSNGGGRWGESGAGVGAGVGSDHKTGGKMGSGSACSGRQCRSSLRCGSEWPYSARRPQGSSRTQSWLNGLAERRKGGYLREDQSVYIRGWWERGEPASNNKKITLRTFSLTHQSKQTNTNRPHTHDPLTPLSHCQLLCLPRLATPSFLPPYHTPSLSFPAHRPTWAPRSHSSQCHLLHRDPPNLSPSSGNVPSIPLRSDISIDLVEASDSAPIGPLSRPSEASIPHQVSSH